MQAKTQTFANHGRFFPLFHFVAIPLTGYYFGYSLLRALRAPSTAQLSQVLFALGVVAATLASRSMVLTVQNRVIRQEMRLRLKELLPPALAVRVPELRVGQLVALRFAGDAEMSSLVQRTLAGEFARPRDIKAAITDWQADYLRA